MLITKPDGESQQGLITKRVCREVFRFDDRNLRRAISKRRLPVHIVNDVAMIDPADAVACIKQWGRNHRK
jgi:hypothetical protein